MANKAFHVAPCQPNTLSTLKICWTGMDLNQQKKPIIADKMPLTTRIQFAVK